MVPRKVVKSPVDANGISRQEHMMCRALRLCNHIMHFLPLPEMAADHNPPCGGVAKFIGVAH
jgi:hypothetical protein